MTTTNKVGSGASMSVSSVGQKRLVIVGATGMVGGYAVRFALDSPAVKSSRMHFRAKTRRCIAWGRTPVRCQTRNFAP
jgi:hypothetical protein